MQRLRLYDCRNSRLPSLLGLCQDDVPGIANYVNTAQRRLIYAKEAGEEGWWGGWAEIAFNVSPSTPYITLPPEIARLELVDVCNFPVAIQNQFYEYLEFGNGRFPKRFHKNRHLGFGMHGLQGFTRNNVVTFYDLAATPQNIVMFPTVAQDAGKRVIIQGLDSNNNVIYSQDDQGNRIEGIIVTLQFPFVTAPMTLSRITGIQKDPTMGPVRFYQQDPTTSVQSPLSTMNPAEMTSLYRRYYINGLPCNCCKSLDTPHMVQVTAIAKLELLPVTTDTDYCLIQNLEAITEECQSVRYSQMDAPAAKTMAAERHIQAIRMLMGELTHYVGKDEPAIQSRPFGSARLQRRRIGTMI